LNIFLLDTNTVSYLIRKQSASIQARIDALGAEDTVAISVITEAEIRFGLALKPEAHQLARTVEFVLAGLIILPWTSDAARAYAALRAENQRLGLAAGSLDMLIAAHAIAAGAVLVTNDGALSKLAGGPVTVNWADDIRPN
jgi:tRNA(fMet)-specific endonuclease VapC